MGAEIDRLEVQVEAQATKANNQLDKLVGKLNSLSNSLSHINSSGLAGLSNGVAKFAQASSQLSNIKTADFTRLIKNIQSLSNLNTQQIYGAASAMRTLSTAINSIGGVSASSIQVAQVAKDISKLGGVNVQKAIANLPMLATAMNNLMATLSNAPSVSNNIIQMTNALANLASHGNRVGSSSNSLVNGLNRTSSAMARTRKSSISLAAAFGKFYASWWLVIRGASKLWDSVKGTADYIEAYNYFDVALGKIGSEWAHQWENYADKIGVSSAEEYANSFQTRLSKSLSKLSGIQIDISADGSGLLTGTGMKNLGLNIREITQYASQLASVTNSVGQTGEVSLAAASAFTKLGADMSSLFNVDYSSVMKNLQSGLIGQSRALYKYGIDITNATLQTYAYELGLSKAVSEMTQAEKMQLRMLAILDQSKVSWGDLANTINSPSNMIRQFGNNMKEVGMVLGQLFIPALQNVLPIANGLAIAFKQLFVNVASFLGIELDLESFGQGYTDLEEDIGGVSDGFEEASNAAKKLKGQLQGFDELNVIKTNDSAGNSSVGGIVDLTKEILEATAKYEQAWAEAYEKMQSKAQGYAEKIAKFFEPLNSPLKKLIESIKKGDWEGIGENASDLAVAFTNLLSDAIEKVDWYEVGTNIGKFLKGIKWRNVINSAGNFVETLFNSALEAYKGSFDAAPIETALITGIGFMSITGLGRALWGKITSALSATILGNSIGFVPTVVISSVTWTIGFDVGKSLGEALFPDDAKYYKEFSWFGDDGFFNVVFSADFDTLFDASVKMSEDFGGLLGTISKLKKELTGEPLKFDDFLGPFVVGLRELSPTIEKFWNEDIKPLFEDRKWSELFDSAKEGIIVKWGEITEEWNKSVSEWWDNHVEPWFTKEKWSELGENLKEGIYSGFKGITNNVIGILNKIIESLESMINTAISGINDMLSGLNDSALSSFFNFKIEIDEVKFGRIPSYKVGGFPEDGLFFANHNELVGQFSNGKTAVVNNEQINTGIKQGVREAVAEILVPYLSDIAQNTRETADKEFGITEEDVSNAVVNQNRIHRRRTGLSLLD